MRKLFQKKSTGVVLSLIALLFCMALVSGAIRWFKPAAVVESSGVVRPANIPVIKDDLSFLHDSYFDHLSNSAATSSVSQMPP